MEELMMKFDDIGDKLVNRKITPSSLDGVLVTIRILKEIRQVTTLL